MSNILLITFIIFQLVLDILIVMKLFIFDKFNNLIVEWQKSQGKLNNRLASGYSEMARTFNTFYNEGNNPSNEKGQKDGQ